MFLRSDDLIESDSAVTTRYVRISGLVGSASCPVAWVEDPYELAMEADKVFAF